MCRNQENNQRRSNKEMTFDIIKSQNIMILIGTIVGFALGLSVGVMISGAVFLK